MVEKNHPQLSVRRQSELLAVNRNRLKAERASVPPALSEADTQVARRMDELYLRFPEFGARRMSLKLTREGYPVSRRRAGRLMEHMGLEAIYRKPRTRVCICGHLKRSMSLSGY
jgi:putative transposase